MTATMTPATAEVGIRWRRGNYCARIDGTDDKYGLRREFERGQTVKAGGGWINYQLGAGWYETREAGARDYFGVTPAGQIVRPAGLADWIAEASAGPLPDTPGAFGGGECECGEPVAFYDPAGFPTCELHAEQSDRFDAPEAMPV